MNSNSEPVFSFIFFTSITKYQKVSFALLADFNLPIKLILLTLTQLIYSNVPKVMV